MNKLKQNLLTITIIWLSFTAILMYDHVLYPVPTAFGYVNRALLIMLVVYVGWRYAEPLTFAIGLIFVGYAIRAMHVGPIGQLSVLQVLTFGIGYIAVSREYAPRDVLRQLVNAGWFVWLWCWFGFVMQLAGGHPLNAGTSIVFQPHVASVLFGMLLPLGVELEHRAARIAYLTLGAGVMLSVIWRSRISAVILAVLVGAYCWRYIRRALWVRLGVIASAAAFAVVGIVYLTSWKPSSVLMRMELWPRTLAAWSADRQTMLFGVGLGRMRIYSSVDTHWDLPRKIARHGETAIMLPSGEPVPMYAPGAHNAYLTTLLETGVVGFTLLLVAILTLWYSRQYRPRGANLAILALLASNLTGDSTHAWHVALLTVCCIATTDWGLVEELRWIIRRERIIGYGG